METIFLVLFGNEMYSMAYHCQACSFFQCYLICYNRSVVELICCVYEVVGSGRKCVKSGLNRTIYNSIDCNYHLGCHIDLVEWWYFFQCLLYWLVLLSQDLAHFLLAVSACYKYYDVTCNTDNCAQLVYTKFKLGQILDLSF